jgi:hypothetical protein
VSILAKWCPASSDGCKERCEPMRAGQAAGCRNFRLERTQHEIEWPTTVSPGDATLRSALSGMPNSHSRSAISRTDQCILAIYTDPA